MAVIRMLRIVWTTAKWTFPGLNYGLKNGKTKLK
jgi:hypothetical protein